MSPRKSSTSSANRSPRPRYLAIEVAGEPPFAARSLEHELRRRLEGAGRSSPALKIIRLEGRRAIIRVDHLDVSAARVAWNGPNAARTPGGLSLRTLRTYGTLRKGKAWIRSPDRSR